MRNHHRLLRLLSTGLVLFGLCLGLTLSLPGCGKDLGDLGAPCLFSSDCKEGLRCVNERCATGSKEGSPCSQPNECEEGLRCVEGACQLQGDACSDDSDCQNDLRCSGGKCLAPAGNGAPCLDTKGCKAPLVCSAEGRCVDAGKTGTKGVGEACGSNADCQRGLACDPNKKQCQVGGDVGTPCKTNRECNKELACANSGSCAKKGDPGTAAANEDCTRPKDCQFGLTCGAGGKCASQGMLPKGSLCAGNQSCEKGLICATVANKNTGECKDPGEPGTKLPGETCDKPLDCSFGSLCGFDGSCVVLRPYPGPSCELSANEDKGPSRVLFEVPRDKDVKEFFRLPYPNDARLTSDGRVNLAGFPNPGPLLGDDIVGAYIQALEKELQGFGTSPTITFRFSKPIRFDTIALNNTTPSIVYLNLDTGTGTGFNVSYNSGKTTYICGSHIHVRAPRGRPLRGGQTYAVVLMKSIQDSDGKALQPDSDFAAMLQDSAPSNSALAAAHARYKKLRDWLKKNETDGKFPRTSDVIAAAVFTTHKPTDAFASFRAAIHQQSKPQLKNVTLCKEGVTSPCAAKNEVSPRGCGKENSKFHEIHATLTLPVFQQGKAPYEKEGGGVRYKSDGAPEVATTQDVCLVMTVPKGDLPTAGWPVMIYAHGTGGNARSHITDGTAERVSAIAVDGKTIGYVTVGIDQVVHGPRRGDSDTHPNYLFFNFRNPQASLGNTLQNAADQHTLVRWLQDASFDASRSPTQKEVTFDKAHITFLGHSQGGFVGPLFLAYEPDVKAAILSGAGGGLIYSLLGKTSPLNIAAGVRALLGEGPVARIDANHPVLNLFQHYYDRADAINYGRLLFQAPPDKIPAKHILQTYGNGDTYTPRNSITALAYAMGVSHAGPAYEDIDNFTNNTLKLPASGNTTHDGNKITALFTQYKPDSNKDGHFVLFHNKDAIQHFTGFLGTLLTDPNHVPTVGP